MILEITILLAVFFFLEMVKSLTPAVIEFAILPIIFVDIRIGAIDWNILQLLYARRVGIGRVHGSCKIVL